MFYDTLVHNFPVADSILGDELWKIVIPVNLLIGPFLSYLLESPTVYALLHGARITIIHNVVDAQVKISAIGEANKVISFPKNELLHTYPYSE